jgi:outer membrane protein assembly factor BamB
MAKQKRARRTLKMTCASLMLSFLLALAACSGPATATISPSASAVAQPGATPATTHIPAPTPSNSPTTTVRPPTAASSTAAVPIPPSTVNATDWTTYHRDNLRTGYLPEMPDPGQLNVAWNTVLDGAVYAEPLVVGGHVLVATEMNTVYSLDAHSGQIEWHTNLGQAVTSDALPCGNISPLGITGTPVYDPATGLIFVVAEVSGPSHILAGLDVHTGEVRVRRSADPDGMDPVVNQQRAALLLSQNMIYVGYGGLYGDCGDYHGWVVASRTDGSGPLLAYQVPTEREGGIWAAPGPAMDATDQLYVSVGNGSAGQGDAWDYSDSVLRLSPALQLEDGFAPEQWPEDNARDADLGSLGPVLLPNGLVFIAGKSGTGYLLRADALGGVGGQLLSKPVCHAYGGAAVVGSSIFVPCNEGVQQIQITAGPNMTLGWRASETSGSPVVGGKTVYSIDPQGILYALDIQTGQVRAAVQVPTTSRFATPTLFGNQVFIGTMTGVVAVNAS